VSFPPDLAADVREAAEAAGWSVSVWMMNAARDRLVEDRSQRTRSTALEELLEMVGPIPDEVYDEVEAVMIEDGALPPDYVRPSRRGRNVA
jgi:hypothetical protein